MASEAYTFLQLARPEKARCPKDKGAMSAEADTMNGADSVPFEEEDAQSGAQDPGLKHLRKIDLTPEEQADYKAKAATWLPGKLRCARFDAV